MKYSLGKQKCFWKKCIKKNSFLLGRASKQENISKNIVIWVFVPYIGWFICFWHCFLSLPPLGLLNHILVLLKFICSSNFSRSFHFQGTSAFYGKFSSRFRFLLTNQNIARVLESSPKVARHHDASSCLATWRWKLRAQSCLGDRNLLSTGITKLHLEAIAVVVTFLYFARIIFFTGRPANN